MTVPTMDHGDSAPTCCSGVVDKTVNGFCVLLSGVLNIPTRSCRATAANISGLSEGAMSVRLNLADPTNLFILFFIHIRCRARIRASAVV